MKEIDLMKAQKKLSYKFIILYFFNCTDIIFTYTFLKTGYFYEANPLMQPIVTLPYLCILIKVLLPGIILLLLFKRVLEKGSRLIRAYQFAISLLILLYGLINCLHLYYLFTLLL